MSGEQQGHLNRDYISGEQQERSFHFKMLAQGAQQQRDMAEFDAGLAQRTFDSVDYILRLTGVGAAFGMVKRSRAGFYTQ